MKLTKQIKADLAKAYQCAMEISILDMKAPLRYINQYVAENVSGYGTAADEKVQSREDYRKMLMKSRQQSKGMLFKAKIITPYKPKFTDASTAQFHDEIVVQIGDKSNRHSIHLYMSCVFKYQFNKWQMVLFHGSMPDAASSTEDTFHVREAEKKLKALEQVVAQRTADLQMKTRELEIEASLERVRAVTMGMNKPGDILNICKVFFNELQALGFKDLRNTLINFWDDENGQLHDYDYSDFSGENFAKLAYSSHPAFEDFQKKIRKAKDAFAKLVINKDGLKSWRQRRRSSGEYKDPRLNKISALYYYFYSTGVGALGISTFSPISKEEVEVLKKFRNVFDMAYQRYVDIQKAEAQGREVQIELALERVRAAAMAMRSSSEIGNLIYHLYGEITKLDAKLDRCFIMIVNPENKGITWWLAGREGLLDNNGFFVSNNQHPSHQLYLNHWKKRTKKWRYLFEGKEKKEWDRFGFRQTELAKLPEPIKKDMAGVKKIFLSGSSDAFGCLITGSIEPLADEHQDIISRFAMVFNQTYTRFLDLKKAEAQAREAKIEFVLERVRSKSMAMHKSEELRDVIEVVYEQFVDLQLPVEHAGFILDYKEENDMHIWFASKQVAPSEIKIPYFDSPHWNSFQMAKAQGKSFFANKLNFEEKNKFYKDLFKWIPPLPDEAIKSIFSRPGLIISTVLLENVGLYIENYSQTPFTDEEDTLLMRFGKVFQQTYTRFLDLQKAEVQTREAQIEAALERVRSRSMAMHKSDELLEAGEILFSEMQKLGIESLTAGFVLMDKEEKNGLNYTPDPSTKKIMALPVIIPHNEIIHMQQVVENWKKGKPFFIVEMDEDETIKHQTFIAERSTNFPLTAAQLIAISPARLFLHNFYFKEGYVLIVGGKKLSVEQTDIMLRFTKVFQQTYTRFLDLQKAEAQAKEAQIETALEKVRSRTMAMQSSNELQETATVLFNEFKKLGTEDIYQVTIGIYNEEERIIDFRATSWADDGAQESRSFSLSMEEPTVVKPAVTAWKANKKSLVIDLSGEALEGWLNYRNKISGITKMSTDTGGRRVITAAYYSKGHLSISTPVPVPADTLRTLERFAAVFDSTYTRFLDLEKAEAQALRAEQDLIAIKEAKQKAEEALTELQATQKQLIQSEKMASLGELTAGIAHEIQNPLNFVNNFSEVSKELLDEMKEAIEKGDTEGAKDIMNDVIQNLEKINHHGKRADGIVKGMLQHSSSGNGKKEPTNINALADEYLRLAYHGLRAKDKSFNATMKTEFDETIGNINIIPQDIGRVILNLITNAFYVVNEKSKQGIAGYEPTVEVNTKKEGDKVLVIVKDNGNGIPQKILDKIFQPFFTTKPTGQGTGLGLSLSYDIVKAHGGELTVKTEERIGSTFIIHLPAKEI